MDIRYYQEIFIEETKEHLQCINRCLLQLEKSPEDKSILNEIFRGAHTLKGMSGTMGFNKMSDLTHEMENVLHALRNNELRISTKIIDLLFKCLDMLENYTSSIIEKGVEGNYSSLTIIQELSGISRNKNDTVHDMKGIGIIGVSDGQGREIAISQYEKNVIDIANQTGNYVYQITVILDKICILKAARAFIIFKTLEKYCEIIKSEPKVQDIEDEKFENEFTVVVISKESAELLNMELNSISEVAAVLIKTINFNSFADASEKSAIAEEYISKKPDELFEDAKPIYEATQQNKAASLKKAKTGKTVRVDIERLDVLLNLVSELIIQKTRIESIADIERTSDYAEALEHLEKITANLHDSVMKVRMVPVETVFNRFPRMVRDISKDLGKEVVLNMSGEETELDRTVIDEIGDPLIHLLRNAVDHGIESIEKRRELGKNDAGNIFLRACQNGNNVVIEVEEDGQGINIDRVKGKAIEKGLISSEMAENLSKKDIIDLLFKPGFSTTDKVTDLSGRGVGLDAVKTKIESLGGTVDVETEPGKGSRFVIRLPLTLAIIQALMVMVGNEKYAIQLGSIQQLINVLPEEVQIIQNQEVVLLRNNIIPVIKLAEILEVPVPAEQNRPKSLKLVIVKNGDKLLGLLVDRILGQHEIVQKPLGRYFSSIRTITSATILGDGNVALILDVNSLLN